MDVRTHTAKRMAARNVSAVDVLNLIDNPKNLPYVAAATGRHSFFGKTADGRELEVIVDPIEFFIVTVIA